MVNLLQLINGSHIAVYIFMGGIGHIFEVSTLRIYELKNLKLNPI